MQLEQQETFEIKSPQLEVFGQVESKLPAPAKKRPFAAGFLAVMVLVSVFGIGGVQLKSRYRNVAEIYTSEVDKHGNSIQGDLTTLTDTAAKAKATGDALDQINSLDASYVSTQSILQREIAQNYTTAAQSYNTMASGFPANVIGTLWGAGQVELYAAQ